MKKNTRKDTEDYFPSTNKFDTMMNSLRKQCERRHDYDDALGIGCFQEVVHRDRKNRETECIISLTTLNAWFKESFLDSLLWTSDINVTKTKKEDGSIVLSMAGLQIAMDDVSQKWID